jgi:hypothetical protein
MGTVRIIEWDRRWWAVWYGPVTTMRELGPADGSLQWLFPDLLDGLRGG